jgi:hypothetical protein
MGFSLSDFWKLFHMGYCQIPNQESWNQVDELPTASAVGHGINPHKGWALAQSKSS